MYVTSVAKGGSDYILTSLTIVRCISVAVPHKVGTMFTINVAKFMVMGILLFCAVTELPVVIYHNLTSYPPYLCSGQTVRHTHLKNIYALYHTIRIFIVFGCLMLFSAYLISKLKASSNENIQQDQQLSRKKKMNSITVTVTVIATIFIACYILNVVTGFIKTFSLLTFSYRTKIIRSSINMVLFSFARAYKFYACCLTAKRFRNEFLIMIRLKKV